MARVKDPKMVVLPRAQRHKALLLEAAPGLNFETDHYRGWPLVLARMGAISDEELRHRVEIVWRTAATARIARGGVSATPPSRAQEKNIRTEV